jgi:serine/threonine-protein kinase RsbW
MPRNPEPLPYEVIIPNSLAAARKVEERIMRQVEATGFSPRCVFGIRLALEEAMVNAFKHGNRGDTSKRIFVSYDISPERVVVRVRDEGPGFDPCRVPDPTSPERVCLPSGRGIMLMRAYLDEVTFSEDGNEVQLVKEKS